MKAFFLFFKLKNTNSILSLGISWLLFLQLACTPRPQKEAPTPISTGWPISSFQQEKMDSTAIYELKDKVNQGNYGPIDHLLLIKNGKKVFDHQFPTDYYKISKGKSGEMGCGIGACKDSSLLHQYNYFHPQWHPYHRNDRELHTIQSVTKSIAATAIGIAIHKGQIKSVDEPLLPYLSDYDLSQVEERLKKATLKDLLCMRLGMEWEEMGKSLDDLANSVSLLEKSEDWVQFILDQPMKTNPGEVWNYNSGASQLLSVIMQKATGQPIDEYTNEFLFRPLGISQFHWKKTPKGLPDTEGGLYLRAEDLAKVGLLYLQDGQWNDEQILAPGWVAEATYPWTDENIPGASGYGYQWWRMDEIEGSSIWFGLGYGGQLLAILPDYQLVAVLNSWNVFGEKYDNILRDFILAIVAANQQWTDKKNY